MKIKILSLLLIATVGISNAQVSVSKQSQGKFKELAKKDFDLIKTKKTIFVMDGIDIEDMRPVLTEVWKVNPFEVVSREEFTENKAAYITDSNAIFEVVGQVKSSDIATATYLVMQYYYPSNIKNNNGKLKYDKNEVAAIFLSGSLEGISEIIKTGKFGDIQEQMYNYQPGYLKNYFQNINNHLLNNTSTWVYETEFDKTKMKALKTATLYVPEYVKMNAVWDGRRSGNEDASLLFNDYEFKVEYIDDDALNTKILKNKSGEEFYYLVYTREIGNKMMTIVNAKTGDIIYKDYTIMSFFVKSKDFKELSKIIKK